MSTAGFIFAALGLVLGIEALKLITSTRQGGKASTTLAYSGTGGGTQYGEAQPVSNDQQAIAGSIGNWVDAYGRGTGLSKERTDKLKQLEIFVGGMESRLSHNQDGAGGARGVFQFDPAGGQYKSLVNQFGEAGFSNPGAQLDIFNQQGLVRQAFAAYEAAIAAGANEAEARLQFWQTQEQPNAELAISRNISEGPGWWATAWSLLFGQHSNAVGTH